MPAIFSQKPRKFLDRGGEWSAGLVAPVPALRPPTPSRTLPDARPSERRCTGRPEQPALISHLRGLDAVGHSEHEGL